ncbi:DNA repair protein RadC [Christensenellaceae bacterium OttesenSCG-928-K19]|nr:DNA repair protein RadC [Christensenellaceae bacterium OttesenSCG-928-K19]
MGKETDMPHTGHRERLKNRFAREGLAGFEDHQALELLLFYAIPRRDTNELAHLLLQTFGSLKNVFAATVEDLQKVPGIGESAAILVKLIPELAAKFWFAGEDGGVALDSVEKAADYAKSLLYGKPVEHFYIICLDAAFGVKSATLLSKGLPTATSVYIRQIAEAAMRSSADKVLVAHNHPGGSPRPSKNDIETTRHIKEALDVLGIQFLDHVIVAGGGYFSFVADQIIRSDFSGGQGNAGVAQPVAARQGKKE